MSMIVPAGKHSVEWVPAAKKMTKTASEGGEAEMVETDSREALYEAAKGVVEAMDAEKCDKCGKCPCGCANAEAGAMYEDDAAIVEVQDGEEAVEEVAEEASIDAVEEAVEKVEEAVEELKDAVEGAEDVEEADDAVEVDVEIEEVPEEEEGIVVESNPLEGCGGPMAASEEKTKDGEEAEDTTEASEKISLEKAASSEEFCKFAKLSPQNRKKLQNYWKNALGYPADYVSLMTKDYEN